LSTKKPRKQTKQLLYGSFVLAGACKLEDAASESGSDDASSAEEDNTACDTLERTFRMTGLTGHKAARHGHRLSGKLKRIGDHDEEASRKSAERVEGGGTETKRKIEEEDTPLMGAELCESNQTDEAEAVVETTKGKKKRESSATGSVEEGCLKSADRGEGGGSSKKKRKIEEEVPLSDGNADEGVTAESNQTDEAEAVVETKKGKKKREASAVGSVEEGSLKRKKKRKKTKEIVLSPTDENGTGIPAECCQINQVVEVESVLVTKKKDKKKRKKKIISCDEDVVVDVAAPPPVVKKEKKKKKKLQIG